MLMKRLAIIWCVLAAYAGSAAIAAPSYRFAFDRANYDVAPGMTVNVTVSLEEIPGSETPVLDANGVGMFGVGIMLADVAPLPADPALVLLEMDIAPNSLFTEDITRSVSTVPPIAASLAEFTDFESFIHADDSTPGQASYFLTIGTFTFTAGLTPGVTHIQMDRYPFGDVNITGQIMSLDDQIATATATITVVPEPPALTLVIVAALLILVFHGWLQNSLAHTVLWRSTMMRRSPRYTLMCREP